MHRTIIHVSLKLYNRTTNNNVAINKIQKALSASVTNLPNKTVTYAFREIIWLPMILCVFFFISFAFVMFIIKNALFWFFPFMCFASPEKFIKCNLGLFWFYVTLCVILYTHCRLTTSTTYACGGS